MRKDRREVPRYFADLTATLQGQESGAPQNVQIEVLSVQGCCIRGEGIPEMGRKCRITLQWHGEQIRMEAQLAWKNSVGLAGMRFHNIDQESSEALRALCSSLRLQPLTPWTALENP